MKNVDFIITTYQRQEGLKNLLDSIFKYYPNANVTVGCQGTVYEGFEVYPIKMIKLPNDYGLSASRNSLVKNTKAKYILLLEDDFVFNEHTDISKMVKIIESNEKIGIVGGMVKEHGQEVHFEHYPRIKEKAMIHESDLNNYVNLGDIQYKLTGSVLNFALFKRQVLRNVKWDDELKLAEHNDFFLRLNQTNWLIAYTPQVYLDTIKINNPAYKFIKKENHEKSIRKLMKKWKVNRIIGAERFCRELKNDKIIYYRISETEYNNLITS